MRNENIKMEARNEVQIRLFRASDLDAVMQIWLSSNLQAHAFIDSDYWIKQEKAVREQIPSAEVYIAVRGNTVCGFIGIYKNTIEGLFVNKRDRGMGIGKSLLDFAKQRHDVLSLYVYQKNEKARRFYRRENFKIVQTRKDSDTKETEYRMLWMK